MTEPTSQRYTLEGRIATGGMGEVWRARDTMLHRDVALKILKQEYADDAGFRDRFATEARNAASLLHPGIASVFDYGELEEEGHTRPFLVMELVEGKPLSEILRSGEPMPPERARDLVGQAAEALAVAHTTGLVHRDIKPANLLVTPEGLVKITDFGIARAADAVALTQTGQLLGTPQYLSPEQAEGRSATAASDVYALGVVLFECLSGERPFSADTPVTTALAHLREPIPELPDTVPDDLAAITRRALAKDPDDRYADASELAAALRPDPVSATGDATRVLTGVVPLAAAAGDAGVHHRRVPRWWPLAAVAGLTVALVLALVLVGNDDAPPAKRATTASTTPATAPAKVRVDPAKYVGKDAGQVAKELKALGLRSRTTTVTNPGGKRPGNVSALKPTGMVTKGTVVILSVWGAPPVRKTPTVNKTPAQKVPPQDDKHGKHGKPGKGKGH